MYPVRPKLPVNSSTLVACLGRPKLVDQPGSTSLFLGLVLQAVLELTLVPFQEPPHGLLPELPFLSLGQAFHVKVSQEHDLASRAHPIYRLPLFVVYPALVLHPQPSHLPTQPSTLGMVDLSAQGLELVVLSKAFDYFLKKRLAFPELSNGSIRLPARPSHGTPGVHSKDPFLTGVLRLGLIQRNE